MKTEYRPEYLANIIGHIRIRSTLRTLIAASQRRHLPVPHQLFTGPPGLGKTTLANALANEIGATFLYRHADGLNLEAVHELLKDLTEGAVLFIDEIHRVPTKTVEALYGALEDYQITIGNDTVELPKFTCLGATTHVGMLPAAFRSRFHHVHHLKFLTPNDLSTVAWYALWAMGGSIEPGACYEIGRRAKGTPRAAVHLAGWSLDYALTHGAKGALYTSEPTRPKVTHRHVCDALAQQGIDQQGLNVLDRQYLDALRTMYKDRPVGVKTLARSLGEEVVTLETDVEPWLVQTGLITQTGQGRMLTAKSRKPGKPGSFNRASTTRSGRASRMR